MYAVYILSCSDDSYYTGQSNDLEKRIWQHETGYFPDCYTFKRRPLKLAWHTIVQTPDEATKLEKQIKGWSRKKKEALIKGDIEELKRLSNLKPHPELEEGAIDFNSSASTLASTPSSGSGVDYIIVGQGICGTWLSYYLNKSGYSILVIDDLKQNSAFQNRRRHHQPRHRSSYSKNMDDRRTAPCCSSILYCIRINT